jgi:hypothetical protein
MIDVEDYGSWLLFVISLPTQNATARMRIWRGLKGMGCAALRDGVYLIPAGEANETSLGRLAKETLAEGGDAKILSVEARDTDQLASFRAMFDRTGDYAALKTEIAKFKFSLPVSRAETVKKAFKALRKEFEAISATDFFPAKAKEQVEEELREAEASAARVMYPGEPRENFGRIQKMETSEFQGRIWATRKNPWVDRLASAWLIRRFIDKGAKVLWIEKPADRPPDAVGFDFDGAKFTHAGGRVTFEVLLSSFGIEGSVPLSKMAAVVHYLDGGGIPAPESAGVEALLEGARRSCKGDDALLSEAEKMFDNLYSAFSE